MVNGLECRLQNSQVISNQACRFRNFFLGPIPELFSASFSPHFQEIQKIMSTQLTLHFFCISRNCMKLCRQKPRLGFPGFARNAKSGFLSTLFVEFPGNATNNVGSAGSTLFEEFPGNATKNVQKKVPEWGPEKSSGICRPGWSLPWPDE